FVLLSEDDLALAGLLKSPLIGLSEDDLFTLAHGRKGTLWRALYEKAMSETAPFVEAYKRLERWRSEADFTPPFDFFLNALARDGGRSRFLARLGAETDDVIDAFLNEVRAYEDRHIPSLQGFVHWFRSGSTTIKRDMEGAGEDIRVMTVHGSKGLEAPIVFLVDGGRPYHASHQPDLVALSENGPPYLWKRRKDDAPRAQAAALARAEDAALSEYYRLLYVAMTRARDRLYVAATGNSKGEADRNGWYSKISDALLASPHTTEIKDTTGNALAWRFRSSDAAPVPPQEIETSVQPHLEIPAFLFEKAKSPPETVRRLTPSDSEIDDHPELNDETGDHDLPGLAATDRGVLMHTLLERLPELSEDQRRSAAERYLNDQAPTTLATTKDRMIEEVINVLKNPRTAPIFQEVSSRAEVAISGQLVLNGRSVDVNAVIDRLIVSAETVHIVDFKTNRSVPSRPRDVPSAYTRQLAIYRALVRRLYPDHSVTASLLWTRTADLMTLDDAALDAAISAI
ncbi:MAG: 3'-5' exonuclease, partial [Pseudomonadota bacterium]